MKRLPTAGFVLAVWLSAGPAPAEAPLPPNIVFVLIDDLGWSDVGCYGNRFVDTPHIDQLAAGGVRFTDFYAAGCVCSPTRASIQSGQNQARFRLTDFIPGHWRPFEKVITPQTRLALPLELTTIAEALKSSGYATGYFGKWHLGWGAGGSPRAHGYDTSIVTGGSHFAPGFRVNPKSAPQPEDGQYLADYLTDRTCEFIRGHRKGPFFAFLSHYAVHIPLQASRELVEKYRSRRQPGQGVHNPVYAAMVEHCDRSVGRIVDELERLDLTSNTVVVFTSDNGGLYKRYGGGGAAVTSNAPLRGEKGSLYEGGIRVPLIIRWPGVVSSGSVCRRPAVSHDLYPTLVAAAGGSLPESQVFDGRSLLGLLKAPDSGLEREAIFFHYPHYHHSRPATAVRAGKWKLIEFLDDGAVELYDLAADIGETKDLAAESGERAAELRGRLHDWRRDIEAAVPMPNPAFKAGRRDEWWSRTRIEPVDMDGLAEHFDRIPVYPGAPRGE
jgi:uncharacterized sulfatase